MTAPSVLVYLSGHGYGHYTRSEAVLERLLALVPGITLHLRSSDRALRLAERAARQGRPLFSTVGEVDVGPGVAQQGPLAVEVAGTRAALQQHLERWEQVVAGEAAFARSVGARLIYGDVPPIAFAVAERAGLPSVALGNFSWSWIYEGYAAQDPWFAGVAARLRAAEGLASLCLGLEMGGGLEVFPRRIMVPPVARPPEHDRDAVRAALFPGGGERPFVLLSFGGFGDELDLDEAARANPGLDLVVVSAAVRGTSPNLRVVDPSPALTHPDLVAAADVVLGKPGYGTVAECLYRPTPLVYAPRGAFREYPPLVEAIQARLPSAPITVEDLRAGRWPEAIASALLAAPRPCERGDGAGRAAERIAALIA